jgi:hypothetical protein
MSILDPNVDGTTAATRPVPAATPLTAATPAFPPDASRLAGLAFTVVPHTHWDRDWYLPFEVFRLRLVGAVERVLDVLEADPRMQFTLDGQAAMVDDVPGKAEEPGRRW